MSADEQKLAELALVENIQRENLTSIEEAKAYIQIMRAAGMTQEELAAKMGKSQSTIANKVRLLNLPDEIQEGISSRKITERHARALLSVEPDKQQEVLSLIHISFHFPRSRPRSFSICSHNPPIFSAHI